MNIVAIIQARISSTRLPGKVLLDLQGKPVLAHVIERVKSCKTVNNVVVATTTNKADLVIVKFCANLKTFVYCGSEEDVLDRYYQAATLYRADHIVRITSDCPLIDPKVIDDVIDLHLKDKVDYTSNTLKETYPDGLDVEVFTFKVLKKVCEIAKLPSEREHVTAYIRKHPDIFKLRSLECKENLSRERWTLDNPEDYEFIKAVYSELYAINPVFSYRDVVDLLSKNPNLSKVNSHLRRNAGYKESLEKDKANLRIETS